MYKFNIKRYFAYGDDISVMINGTRKKIHITRSELSKQIGIPNSTIKDNELKYRNPRLIEKCKDFLGIADFNNFNIIDEVEDCMNKIYVAVFFSQINTVKVLAYEIEDKYRNIGKNNLIGILIDLILIVAHGSYDIENNSKLNTEKLLRHLNNVQWFLECLYPDHQALVYDYSALIASRLRNHLFALEQLEKVKKVFEETQRPLLLYHFAIINQFASEYSAALYYAQEAVKELSKFNNIERVAHMNNNMAWCYIKLKNFEAAHQIIDSFLPVAMVSDSSKFRFSTLTNHAYLLYFEYEFDEAYEYFKKIDCKEKYEQKIMMFLLSLKLRGKGEYANEISIGYMEKKCWSGYYLASLYFQSIYATTCDYHTAENLYEEVMNVFQNNKFTSIYDVIVKEHEMYNEYHRYNKFIELQRNYKKLKELESTKYVLKL